MLIVRKQSACVPTSDEEKLKCGHDDGVARGGPSAPVNPALSQLQVIAAVFRRCHCAMSCRRHQPDTARAQVDDGPREVVGWIGGRALTLLGCERRRIAATSTAPTKPSAWRLRPP